MKICFYILCLTALIACSSVSISQNYYSLPDSNATWITSDNSSSGPYHVKFWLNDVNEDTLINQIPYSKIFLNDGVGIDYYAGAFRSDDNGKSFFVPPYDGYTDEHLWYDFTLEKGDTAHDIALNDMAPGLVGLYNLAVDSVGYIEVGQYFLKYMYLTPIPPLPPYYNGDPIVWVERIGSLNGGLYNMYMCGLNQVSLRCMSSNDTIFYFSPLIDCGYWYLTDFIYEQGICELPVNVKESINDLSQIYVSSANSNEVIIYNPEFRSIRVTICNLYGQVIYKNSNIHERDKTRISNIPSGIKLIKIYTTNNCVTHKTYVK